jgi:hypothetical protein
VPGAPAALGSEPSASTSRAMKRPARNDGDSDFDPDPPLSRRLVKRAKKGRGAAEAEKRTGSARGARATVRRRVDDDDADADADTDTDEGNGDDDDDADMPAPGGKKRKAQRTHKCAQCGKAFPSPSGLRIHMNSHMLNKRARPPACVRAR